MVDRLNGYGMMGIEPDGEFVRYSDFARLEAENRELRAKLETVRAETLEEAARVAEGLPDQRGNSPEHLVGRRIAAAIRSLKDKDQQNG
jgi:hypothetical protein